MPHRFTESPPNLKISALISAVAFAALIFPSLAQADVGVYEPDRYYASTVGKVRWLAHGEATLYVSDLRRQVAAIDLNKGTNRWTRFAAGSRLNRVWKAGKRLVLSGRTLEVLDVHQGKLLWSQRKGCTPKGSCKVRVLGVDDVSVYISIGARAHHLLDRLSLSTGKSMWPNRVRVGHPQKLLSHSQALAVVDALPPYRARLMSKVDGKELSSWVWRGSLGAVPSHFVNVVGADAAVAIRTQTTDGLVARLAVLRLGGAREAKVEVGRRLPTRAVWAGVAGADFFGLIPHPSRPETVLVKAPLKGGLAKVALRSRTIHRPVIAQGRLIAASHDGTHAILSALGGLGRKDQEVTIQTPLIPKRLLKTNDRVIAILAGDRTAPFMVFDPERGQLDGVGSLVQPRAEPHQAIRAGNQLYMAEGRGVQGYYRRGLTELGKKLQTELLDDSIETAFLTFSAVSLLLHRNPAVPPMLRSLLAQRTLALRHLTEQGKRLEALREVLNDLDSRLNQDRLRFRLRWRPFASFLADKVLAGKRALNASEIAVVLGIKRRIVRLLRTYQPEAEGSTFEPQLRSLVVVLAAILVRANLPAQGADLMQAWLAKRTDSLPGLRTLYQALAIAGLDRLFRKVRSKLLSADDGIRQAAAKTLGAYAHGVVALTNANLIRAAVAQIRSSDPNISRGSANTLVKTLSKLIKKVAKQVGKPLTRPGCNALCESIGATCLNRCRQPEACEKATKQCLKTCRRGRLPKWRPPGGIPSFDEETKICD